LGWCLIDIAFRLERRFGVRISGEELLQLAGKHDPPDIRVGELFDFIRRQAHVFGVLDCEQDAEILWPLYRRELSDGLGIDEEHVTKDKWFVRELGGS
jgi:hypothetical protein